MKRIFGTVRSLAVLPIILYILSIAFGIDRQFLPAMLLLFIAVTGSSLYMTVASLEKRLTALEAEKKPPK